MSHSGLLYLFWEQDFGRSNRPISKMHIFTYISIIYIIIVFMLFFIFKFFFKFFIQKKNKTKTYKRYIVYFFISFCFIFFYLSKDLSLIIKLRSHLWINNLSFNIYIQDYNIFIKELYILYFLYLFTFYRPFILFFGIYTRTSIFFNYKGILFVIYFFVSAYFFSLVLAQNQLINEIGIFILENTSFRKPFSTLNVTALLFNFKGYFYDIFRISAILNLIVYIYFFCRKVSNEIYLILKKNNSLYIIRWCLRILFYFIYLYFLSSFIYKFFFYFFISRLLCIEYSLFFIRFRWYLKGSILLKIK